MQTTRQLLRSKRQNKKKRKNKEFEEKKENKFLGQQTLI